MTENRKHLRVGTRLRCWCEGNIVTFYARVGNISEGGLFLRTSTPLPRGTRARVRLDAREGLAFSAEATVMWARLGSQGVSPEGPPGMGLRFEALPDPLREQLQQLLRVELEREQARPSEG